MAKARPVPTDIDYARLAAYIDGEGNVDVCYKKCVKTYFAQVVVTNTDPRLIVWLYETFGGFIRHNSWEHRQNRKWRETLVWYITCKKAVDLLIHCRPYLISKADQADILFAFQATVGRVGVKGHSPQTIAARDQMRRSLKELRHKSYPAAYLSKLAGESKSGRVN